MNDFTVALMADNTVIRQVQTVNAFLGDTKTEVNNHLDYSNRTVHMMLEQLPRAMLGYTTNMFSEIHQYILVAGSYCAFIYGTLFALKLIFGIINGIMEGSSLKKKFYSIGKVLFNISSSLFTFFVNARQNRMEEEFARLRIQMMTASMGREQPQMMSASIGREQPQNNGSTQRDTINRNVSIQNIYKMTFK